MRRAVGVTLAFALRSKVKSSKFHFGEASFQISFENSRRYFS